MQAPPKNKEPILTTPHSIPKKKRARTSPHFTPLSTPVPNDSTGHSLIKAQMEVLHDVIEHLQFSTTQNQTPLPVEHIDMINDTSGNMQDDTNEGNTSGQDGSQPDCFGPTDSSDHVDLGPGSENSHCALMVPRLGS
jgi:hypothetical protein